MKQDRRALLSRYEIIIEASRTLTASERESLAAWEFDGHPTSEWGGWPVEITLDYVVPHKPTRPHIPSSVRKAVYERDAYRCVVCQSWLDLTLDHVIPYSQGGPDTIDNLQTMCRSHNSSKGART